MDQQYSRVCEHVMSLLSQSEGTVEAQEVKVSRPKLMVIGLDSASFLHILPLVRQGQLPNLSKLMEQGAWGTLWADAIPSSPSGWTTSMTGVNLGVHGVTVFHKPNSYEKTMISSGDRNVPAIWTRLSQAGKRLVIMNVPMTYPPETINGVMVTSLMSPEGSTYTFPSALTEALKSAGYKTESGWNHKQVYVEDTKLRTEVALCLSKLEWDFFLVVFTNLDRVWHRCGKDTDFVLKFYSLLDDAVGRLIGSLSSDDHVLLLSDHGMRPYPRVFQTNFWLAQQGYFYGRSNSLLIRAFDRFAGKAFNFAPCMVDWSRTKAYSPTSRAININVQGREPQGIVEPGAEYEDMRNHIISKLRKTRDPDTGQLIFRSVSKKEELFTGPRMDWLPDIFFEADESYYLGYKKRAGKKYAYTLRSPFHSHDAHGMFLLKGPGVVPGGELEAEIADITPTMLYLLNQQVPSYMEGKVISEAFLPEYLSLHPIWIAEEEIDVWQLGEANDLEMDEEVRRRLEALGYLG